MELDVREGGRADALVVAEPGDEDIARALGNLDQHRHTELALVDEDGEYVVVGGGRGRYHVRTGAVLHDDRAVLHRPVRRRDRQPGGAHRGRPAPAVRDPGDRGPRPRRGRGQRVPAQRTPPRGFLVATRLTPRPGRPGGPIGAAAPVRTAPVRTAAPVQAAPRVTDQVFVDRSGRRRRVVVGTGVGLAVVAVAALAALVAGFVATGGPGPAPGWPAAEHVEASGAVIGRPAGARRLDATHGSAPDSRSQPGRPDERRAAGVVADRHRLRPPGARRGTIQPTHAHQVARQAGITVARHVARRDPRAHWLLFALGLVVLLAGLAFDGYAARRRRRVRPARPGRAGRDAARPARSSGPTAVAWRPGRCRPVPSR